MSDDVRYLVYKATGGLAHACGGLGTAILLARTYGRTLLVDFECCPLYGFRFGEWFYISREAGVRWSDTYASLPCDVTWQGLTRDELARAACVCLGEYRGYAVGGHALLLQPGDTSNSPAGDARVVVVATSKGPTTDMAHIRVTPRVLHHIGVRARRLRGAAVWVGLHYRNTDLRHELAPLLHAAAVALTECACDTLLLATDDAAARHHVVAALRDAVPHARVVRISVPPRLEKGRAVHVHAPDKREVLLACLADMYMCVRACAFIPSPRSGMSRWVCAMRDTIASTPCDSACGWLGGTLFDTSTYAASLAFKL